MFEHLNARAREAAVGFQETLRQAYTAEDRRYIVGRLCETGEALLLALAETPWRPIEEAPKDGTWIYVIGPEYETPMPAQWGLLNINPNKYNGVHGWSGNGYIFGDATHWTPIVKDWPQVHFPCDNCDGTGRITTGAIGGEPCPECCTFSAPPKEAKP